jgi:hypothetical protein
MGRREDRAKGRVITGLSPPGGLVLAQLHFGSLHAEGSQEYPAAAELLVGPLTLPSWARERAGKRNARMARERIGTGKGGRNKRKVRPVAGSVDLQSELGYNKRAGVEPREEASYD